ncbi:MAG: hypothetical protein AMS26_01205 [Bacteroides sp. SM23_62]|nr:MAG: hypothetical protein AMS26_01205 [Bacteroides sp. SM23_62]
MKSYIIFQDKKLITVAGLILVFLLGYTDYIIGYAFSFSLFYLIPIIIVTWYAGFKIGIFISICSGIAWFFADTLSQPYYSHVLVPYWNAFVRFGIFLVVTTLLAKLKVTLDKEKQLARKDVLTQSWNSLAFYELAKNENARALRYNHAITLAYIDLDNFKSVNDQFGHLIGDRLLIEVVQVIHHRIRTSDILARLGGDEFALLLPETDGKAAKYLINRIRRELLAVMKKNDWPVTFSIGMTTFTKPDSSVKEMLQVTDELMYQVKRNKKNDIMHKIFN